MICLTFIIHLTRDTCRFEDLKGQGDEQRKRQIILFLQDFCQTAKSVQLADRKKFFHALASNGIFQQLPPLLLSSQDNTSQDGSSDITSVKMAVTDIIINILEHEPALLRSFILAQTRNNVKPLTETLIEQLHTDEDEGMQLQYVEMLKMLLDWSRVDASEDSDCTNFLFFFYNENFSLLVSPLRQLNDTTMCMLYYSYVLITHHTC